MVRDAMKTATSTVAQMLDRVEPIRRQRIKRLHTAISLLVILAGLLAYPAYRGAEILGWTELFSPSDPLQLGPLVPPPATLPASIAGTTASTAVLAWSGTKGATSNEPGVVALVTVTVAFPKGALDEVQSRLRVGFSRSTSDTPFVFGIRNSDQFIDLRPVFLTRPDGTVAYSGTTGPGQCSLQPDPAEPTTATCATFISSVTANNTGVVTGLFDDEGVLHAMVALTLDPALEVTCQGLLPSWC